MRPHSSFVAICVLALVLVGCAGVPDRIPYTRSEQAIAVVDGMPDDIRVWADASLSTFEPSLRQLGDRLRRTGEPMRLLALSGGADRGAYGAGFLNGWTMSGDRPEFLAVSGVSTGALIAPYAFLGSAYDDKLREVFTEVDARDIFRVRGLAGLLGDGLVSDKPLREMVAKHVTPELLEAIAAEHRKGRVLLVATTNLDAQRGVIWDMGRIAEVGTPRALEVFRNVLLASASIPAIFPPKFIEVNADGRRYKEMHVDGGATRQVLTLPNAVLISQALPQLPRGSAIYTIINNQLAPEFKVMRASTIPIAERAISTLIKSSAQQTVQQTWEFTQDRRIRFQLTFIGNDFVDKYPGPFNQEYMNALFQYGLARGKQGTQWRTRPPFERERAAGAAAAL